MPTAWRVHVIEAALRAEGIDLPVSDCDVSVLPAPERRRVVDVLIAEQASFPMVMVGDDVVCHAELDLDAIVRAAREGSPDDGCC
ncbi:MAG: hypothetical protein RBS17_07665 [Coriobacteriia bacterium]|nr:hypothetical protein [Coriobacteriia bacterium]